MKNNHKEVHITISTAAAKTTYKNHHKKLLHNKRKTFSLSFART